MLKKALTTTALATVLLTSSISANELVTQGFSGSTAKVETIGAFNNIPTQSLNSSELKTHGELWWIPSLIVAGAFAWEFYSDYYHTKQALERNTQNNDNYDYNEYY